MALKTTCKQSVLTTVCNFVTGVLTRKGTKPFQTVCVYYVTVCGQYHAYKLTESLSSLSLGSQGRSRGIILLRVSYRLQNVHALRKHSRVTLTQPARKADTRNTGEEVRREGSSLAVPTEHRLAALAL